MSRDERYHGIGIEGGCGAAVFAGVPQNFATVGILGVAFAFGLAVVAICYWQHCGMSYKSGHIISTMYCW